MEFEPYQSYNTVSGSGISISKTPDLVLSHDYQHSASSDDDEADRGTLLTPQFLPVQGEEQPSDMDLLFGEDELEGIDVGKKARMQKKIIQRTENAIDASSGFKTSTRSPMKDVLVGKSMKAKKIRRDVKEHRKVEARISRERQVEEETRGRGRFPRLLWRSSLCNEQIDILDSYYQRVVGSKLPEWPQDIADEQIPYAAGIFDRQLLQAGL